MIASIIPALLCGWALAQTAQPAPAAAIDIATQPPAGVDAQALLRDADRARGATKDGISWDVTIEETTAEGATHTVRYFVKALDNDAYAEAVAPARNKGEVMLFNDRNLWFFKPGLKKPVSISPRQKLLGQAANGDIASTQYFRDYDGTVLGEETIDGAPSWKLALKAKAKNVTYDRITYWISKKSHEGIKAEFLTVGGDVFKRASFTYDNRMKVGDHDYSFVSKMIITDALNPKLRTVMSYEKPRVEKHAASLFNVNNLVR